MTPEVGGDVGVVVVVVVMVFVVFVVVVKFDEGTVVEEWTVVLVAPVTAATSV
jgi:hypothetical protein